mmetsp:Transcript_3054/g.9311  ORF Transcript_3054/g.9311 Transcript_3054/m.9311 type:complete len:82 (-) Transcript_3054:7-252(-)
MTVRTLHDARPSSSSSSRWGMAPRNARFFSPCRQKQQNHPLCAVCRPVAASLLLTTHGGVFSVLREEYHKEATIITHVDPV